MKQGFQIDTKLCARIVLLSLLSVLLSCMSVAQTSYGLLPNGLRDKYKWPFDSSSLWNTAIGSGAVYQSAGITYNNLLVHYYQYFKVDQSVIIMTPTAPATELWYSSAGWGHKSRCSATGSVLDTVPIPASLVIPSDGGNESTAILRADGMNVEQNQPLARCTAGGVATTNSTWPDVGIYGTNPTGAHGGSGLSALGGPIRYGEFTYGKIQHPLQLELWAKQYYYCCSPIWPATNVDGYANSTTYGGTNPNMAPGSLMALLPSFNVSALKTTPGKIIAQALIDYGGYLVDDVYSNGFQMTIEEGPAGSVLTEFQNLYGFSMNNPGYPSSSPFMSDIVAIYSGLNIVTNNSSSSIGGGGTPRQPPPPAIGN